MSRLVGISSVGFETPGFLALLALAPLLIAFSFRPLAALGGARRIVALLLRTAVLTCGVLALAGAQCVRVSDALSVIFLLDRSNSVPREQQQQAFDFVAAATGAMRPTKDRVGVIAFDGRSAVEQLPGGALGIDRISEPVEPDRTDIAAALRMALALFSGDTARRVVVLSDGNENVGDALTEALHYGASRVPIDVLPLRYAYENEVVFERMSAPPNASTEETINLQLVLRSTRAVSGRILLFQNDRQVDLDPDSPDTGYRVQLDPGPNRLTIPVPLRSAMVYRFQAKFVPDDPSADAVSANNESRAFTVVSGRQRVLIVATETPDDWASAHLLADALRRERLDCDVMAAGESPLSQELLLGYGLVILSNVPAHLFDESQRRGLAAYVRDLGGGLVMVGGDNSFGAG
ncbi:MAG: VWA domain-containing protein, partial [Planctomycetota bacterium]